MKQRPRPTISSEEYNQWRHTVPTPAPDLPALRKTLAAVDADPAMWDQRQWGEFRQDQSGEWSCGTARCVAGWAATLAPAVVVSNPDVVGNFRPVLNVPATAQHALGLTEDEAWQLFNVSMNIGLDEEGSLAGPAEQRRNIQTVAERIAARAGETL